MAYESVLDTPYETELRMLLLLCAIDSTATGGYLAALDTLIVNAKTLGVGEHDLNGTHRLAAGEIVRRNTLANLALKDLTLRGLVSYRPEQGGTYMLTRDGRHAANAMTTAYSKQFSTMTERILKRFGNASEKMLLDYIDEQSITGGEVR